MLSENQLKELHGKEYVELFESQQSNYRLGRLIKAIKLDAAYKIIDFGCGNGMLLPFLADRVDRYTGIDFSEEFIKAAERKRRALSIDNAEFICEDILKYCEINKEYYDVAFAMDFSEHVYDNEWLNILKAIKFSLKDGGKLYIHTPNSEFFLEKMKKKNFIFKQFPEHIAVRSVKENCDLLKMAGFEVSEINLIPHYNILRLLHPISFIPVIGRFFKARIFIELIVRHDGC